MRKHLMYMSILLLSILLIGCTNKQQSNLEQTIKAYPYYTKLYEYDGNEQGVKLFLAFNFRSDFEPIQYVFKLDGEQHSAIEIMVNENRIYYEELTEQGYEIYVLDSSKLSESVQNKEAELKLLNQEGQVIDTFTFMLRTETYDLREDIENNPNTFKQSKNYIEEDIKHIETKPHTYILVILVIVLGSFGFYFFTLFLYKWLYEQNINKKLNNPDYSLSMIDLTVIKSTMKVITGLLAMGCFIVIISFSGYLNYKKDGQLYFSNNSNYTMTSYVLEEDFTFDIDISKVNEYEGDTVINHALFETKIKHIQKDEKELLIGIELDSRHSFFHAKIISHESLDHQPSIHTSNSTIKSMNVVVVIDDQEIEAEIIGYGPNTRESRYLYISLINKDDRVELDKIETLSVRIENLIVNEYKRN